MELYKLALFAILIGAVSCTSRAKYNKMIEDGLNSDQQFNDLFLGISLGMPDSAFRAHCFELNQQKQLFQGNKGLSVFYRINELKYPVNMNFYPNFFSGKIFQLPVIFDYEGWAPWNKKFYSDSLQLDVLRLFEEWYGPGFLEVRHSEKGSAFVKVDGNRQISIFKVGDRFVKALFTDIKVEKEIKDSEAEKAD